MSRRSAEGLSSISHEERLWELDLFSLDKRDWIKETGLLVAERSLQAEGSKSKDFCTL